MKWRTSRRRKIAAGLLYPGGFSQELNPRVRGHAMIHAPGLRHFQYVGPQGAPIGQQTEKPHLGDPARRSLPLTRRIQPTHRRRMVDVPPGGQRQHHVDVRQEDLWERLTQRAPAATRLWADTYLQGFRRAEGPAGRLLRQRLPAVSGAAGPDSDRPGPGGPPHICKGADGSDIWGLRSLMVAARCCRADEVYFRDAGGG